MSAGGLAAAGRRLYCAISGGLHWSSSRSATITCLTRHMLPMPVSQSPQGGPLPAHNSAGCGGPPSITLPLTQASPHSTPPTFLQPPQGGPLPAHQRAARVPMQRGAAGAGRRCRCAQGAACLPAWERECLFPWLLFVVCDDWGPPACVSSEPVVGPWLQGLCAGSCPACQHALASQCWCRHGHIKSKQLSFGALSVVN